MPMYRNILFKKTIYMPVSGHKYILRNNYVTVFYKKKFPYTCMNKPLVKAE